MKINKSIMNDVDLYASLPKFKDHVLDIGFFLLFACEDCEVLEFTEVIES